MGLVTININAMREMLTGITTAQSEVENLRLSLDRHMSNARWHVNKAPPPFVSTTRLGEVVDWLERQNAPVQIRIELAELLAHTNTEIREVKIDESWLDQIDLTSAATDANTLQFLLHRKNIAGILDILDKHQTQIPVGDGSSVTLYDPVFGAILAKNLTPTQFTDVLALLNSGGEKTNATQYDRLLRSIAGTLSTGARALSPDDLHTFTDAWAALASIGPYPIDPVPDRFPKHRVPTERVPSDSPGLPPIPPDPQVPHSALPIQLLSLIIARGQWPDEFLTGMYNAITTEEDGAGANHWLKKPHSVWDPGVPDPATGGYTLITDPMWGIFNTAVNNPEWVYTTFGTGDTTTLTIPDLDADPIIIPVPPRGHVFQPLMSTEVNTALHALLERGTADSATATTLVSMLSASDAYQVATGAQPTLLPQIDPILTDLQQIRNLSDAVHTLLDILSMIPLIGEAADLINGILYTIDNDKLNAALCFASILLPSALGLAVTAPRWIKLIRPGTSAIDNATTVITAGRKLSDLTPNELNALENTVRTHTTTQLDAHVREVYTHMDELGITSNRARKTYLNEHLGPAYSTVYNPHTGEFYTAINDPSGYAPKTLDPRLEEKIKSMPEDVVAAHSERGTTVVDGVKETPVGTHAEIYAADAALKADPTLQIEDLVIDTRRTGTDPKNPTGTDFEACPHCAWILQGATIITG